MKKLNLIFIMMILAAASLVSQEPSGKYKTFLARAKQYESDKKYVYALGSYYDAIAAEPTLLAKEAYDSFVALKTLIEEGNPGFKTDDEFVLHDSWKSLLSEFERYWTENVPLRFYVEELQKGDVDFVNRTTNYTVPFGWDDNIKYTKMLEIFMEGYWSAKRSDWTDLPEIKYKKRWSGINYSGWPNLDLGESFEIPDSGEKNGVLYSRIHIEYDYKNDRDNKIYKKFYMRSNTFISSIHGRYYNIFVDIIDEKGNVLWTEERNFPNHTFYYATETDGYVNYDAYRRNKNFCIPFKNIPQNISNLINSGKAKVKVASLFLEYGTLERHFKRQIPLSQVIFDSLEGNKDIDPIKIYENLNAEAVKTQAKADANKEKESAVKEFVSQFNSLVVFVPETSVKISKNAVSKKFYYTVMETYENKNEAMDESPVKNLSKTDVQNFFAKLNAECGFSGNEKLRLPAQKELDIAKKFSKSLGFNYADSAIYFVKEVAQAEAESLNEAFAAERFKEIDKMVSFKNQNFVMSLTEVTQKQYEEITGKNPSRFKGKYNPVENVSWIDAIEFCNALSEKRRLKKCYSEISWTYYDSSTGEAVSQKKYEKERNSNKRPSEYKYTKVCKVECDFSANGYRLPTVEEWQAVRYGTENTPGNKTSPVGMGEPNSYGLYDINGNVAEWCWDRYFVVAGSRVDNSSDYRKVCGSSYDNEFMKDAITPVDSSAKESNIGFRIVRTAK